MTVFMFNFDDSEYPISDLEELCQGIFTSRRGCNSSSHAWSNLYM